ncbi:MAG: hypothetical protein NC908_04060, partial [Candidatus Omnitrophica bacterium]|nr:hypothetical protein [Candidatus Omnitrophota bacterium]
MNRLGERLSWFILMQSKLVIVITFFITLIAICIIPRIRFDNSVDVFFDKKSKNYIEFQEWKKHFGSDDTVVMAFSDEDIFTYENLNLISKLTKEFESLEHVRKVNSLTNANDIRGSEEEVE